MNAGKITTLIQSSSNFAEKGMKTLHLKPHIDDREGAIQIPSRIGLEAEAVNFYRNDNHFKGVQRRHHSESLHCILIDEAQFLNRTQVIQLCDAVDNLKIPVLSYGLLTVFEVNCSRGATSYLLGPTNCAKSKPSVTEARKLP